jgi:hypothetical protein
LGWVRANLLYDRQMRPIPANSLMEKVFFLVWRMRQEIEFQKARATMQALALLLDSQEKAKIVGEAFTELRHTFFPYDRKQGEEEKMRLRKVVFQEAARGPISVTPMVLPKPKRKKHVSTSSQRPSGVFFPL